MFPWPRLGLAASSRLAAVRTQPTVLLLRNFTVSLSGASDIWVRSSNEEWTDIAISRQSLAWEGSCRSGVADWVQAEMEAFNSKWGRKGASPNVVEFLVLAQKAAHGLYTHTFQELGRQVTAACH